jgi:hypothetical protein
VLQSLLSSLFYDSFWFNFILILATTNDGKFYELFWWEARPETNCSRCYRNSAAAAADDREEGGIPAEED